MSCPTQVPAGHRRDDGNPEAVSCAANPLDAGLLREISDLFLREYPGTLHSLRAAAEAGNAVEMERLAHNLKGAVANFGAESATAAALQLELCARNHELHSAACFLSALETALAQLRPQLERAAAAP